MITIKNLYKAFGDHKVLKGINLEVNDGETMVIFGKSGSGKSVTLQCLMGLMDLDEGSIFIDDIEVGNLKKTQRYKKMMHVGMLFQSGALFDSMSVGQNVGFFLSQHPIHPETGDLITKEEIEHLSVEALKRVGLDNTFHLMPHELSGGMRKRVALARAIVYRPKVLCYDEPTTGLDPLTGFTISQLIVEIQELYKVTSLVVTHDIPSALHVADRMALIEEGKIEYVGTPEDFLNYDHPTVHYFDKIIGHDRSLIRRKS